MPANGELEVEGAETLDVQTTDIFGHMGCWYFDNPFQQIKTKCEQRLRGCARTQIKRELVCSDASYPKHFQLTSMCLKFRIHPCRFVFTRYQHPQSFIILESWGG